MQELLFSLRYFSEVKCFNQLFATQSTKLQTEKQKGSKSSNHHHHTRQQKMQPQLRFQFQSSDDFQKRSHSPSLDISLTLPCLILESEPPFKYHAIAVYTLAKVFVVVYFFAATFDAKTVYTDAIAPLINLKPMGGVEVQQMPYLNHMTLCVWTKMPQTSVTGFRHNVLVNYHEESSKKGFALYFTHWDGAEASIPPSGRLSFSNPDRFVT